MKVFFRNIHLYLSLAAGLIIFTSCLTGTILVFEEEIEQALNHDRYFVATQNKRLPLTELAQTAVKSTPKSKLSSIKVYSDSNRSVEVSITVAEKKDKKDQSDKTKIDQKNNAKGTEKSGLKQNDKKNDKKKPTTTVYIDPYSGKVLDVVNPKKSFFSTVESVHRWLLGGKDSVGNFLIGFSTFFFLFILITGLILWWPKTKKILYQRLKIKFDGGWKRIVHDLHMVTGFYTSIFLIIIVLSGLVMAFNWVNKGIFTITGTKIENPEPPSVVYQENIKQLTIDDAYHTAQNEVNKAKLYVIRVPKDSISTFSVNVLPLNTIETAGDTYFIDPYTGKIIGAQKFADKNKGQKIRAMVKPLHTGSIYGLPSKIISFIICLLSLIFPVTGVIMWLNRIKINKKKGKQAVQATEAS
ncbi:PepSY-associated TM helix domain-containing protein [Solitalea lacus]|uniref:PepSY-associated TM helix domain-containing protein n=1 Tax=Solitalea lacus TaxID=2911172 RepID=UPI001EDBD6BF|nr:PepSY-associated TM helix domain-containing protein [Solitalea lacus]UKJ08719.1 PepSY domain-containing protein [Solitalea lacus]